MAGLGGAAGYVYEQGRLGQEERQASQLAQLKFEQARQKAQEEAAAKKSLGAYLGGSLGQLASQSPELAGQAVKMQSEQQKMDLERRSVMVDTLAGIANSFVASPNPATYQKFVNTYAQVDPQTQLPSYDEVARNPNMASNAANQLMGLSQQLKLEKAKLEAQGTPGVHVPFSREIESQKARIAAAGRAPKEYAPSDIGKLKIEQARFSPGSKDWLDYEKAIQQKGKGSQVGSITMADGTVVTFGGESGGNVGLTKPVVNDIQKDVIKTQQNLSNLDQVASSYKQEYLTATGKAQKAMLGWRDFVAPGSMTKEQKDFLAGNTKFAQQVDQMFNLYRQEITGAAAAVRELTDLKKTMLNTSLSPTEFEASFNNFRETLQRTLRLKNKLLREGIKLSEYEGKPLAVAIATGADDDVNARGDELKGKGLSDEQVVAVLEREGYVKPRATGKP
ncbi:MAG: hypothetical protein HQL90_04295 [Magnetococcales bacterium]|nr:hypothetical protein [Magnetococcales bacterium]